MIQRIQSIYLLVVLIAGLLIFFLNPTYATFENVSKDKVKLGYVKTTDVRINSPVGNAKSKYINYLLIAFISLGACAAIFLYKKPGIQKKVCIYLTLLSALLIVIMFLEFSEQSKQMGTGALGVGAIIPIAFMVCCILAWNHIRSDVNLLKSMDRIR